MSTQLHGLPVRRADVVLVDETTRSALVVPDQTTTHVLNPTARAIWELCDGRTTTDEMVDAICRVFAVPPDVAARDVELALDQMTRAGLVHWTDAETGAS